jgi:hypothetical protein
MDTLLKIVVMFSHLLLVKYLLLEQKEILMEFNVTIIVCEDLDRLPFFTNKSDNHIFHVFEVHAASTIPEFYLCALCPIPPTVYCIQWYYLSQQAISPFSFVSSMVLICKL